MEHTYQTTKEIASEIRDELKKEFPECKFSVTKETNSITVALMEAPESPFSRIDPNGWDGTYAQLNHFYIEETCNGAHLTRSAVKMLQKVTKISNKKNWDRSDIQCDYFDVNFYFYLEVGKYNKPFQVVKK